MSMQMPVLDGNYIALHWCKIYKTATCIQKQKRKVSYKIPIKCFMNEGGCSEPHRTRWDSCYYLTFIAGASWGSHPCQTPNTFRACCFLLYIFLAEDIKSVIWMLFLCSHSSQFKYVLPYLQHFTAHSCLFNWCKLCV